MGGEKVCCLKKKIGKKTLKMKMKKTRNGEKAQNKLNFFNFF